MKVLIIDDNEQILNVFRIILKKKYQILTATSAENGLEIAKIEKPEVVFLDNKLPKKSGYESIVDYKKYVQYIIMISGHSNIKIAVDAMKLGIYDFVEKPFDEDRILKLLKSIEKELNLIKNFDHYEGDAFELIGNNEAILKIKSIIPKIALSNSTVLIQGENGTGKEIVAHLIYEHSQVKGNFIVFNCAALPENLIESELFGYKKGAFTGADRDKIGKLEMADNGIIFLDEIGDMTLSTQAKLLRVLQFKTFSPLGSNEEKRVNVRFVAATNKNLLKEIEKGNFRKDLYFRLNEIPIVIPPLRKRKDDVEILIQYFLRIFNVEKDFVFTKDALETLSNYSYPGNIRELKNFIKRIIAVSDKKKINKFVLKEIIPELFFPNEYSGEKYPTTYREYINLMERKFILEALEKNDWNILQTAKDLDMQRSNLYKKIEKYGLKKK